jgi:predicted RNA-binding protein Jag
MSEQSNQDKAGFVKLVLDSVESDSESKEAARAFLASEGLNPDQIVADGLKRIKQMQMKLNAQQTQEEMIAAESSKEKAIQWVENLLESMDFSLTELVQREGLQVSFRNMEELSREDIKNILIKHFTLKFAGTSDDSNAAV